MHSFIWCCFDKYHEKANRKQMESPDVRPRSGNRSISVRTRNGDWEDDRNALSRCGWSVLFLSSSWIRPTSRSTARSSFLRGPDQSDRSRTHRLQPDQLRVKTTRRQPRVNFPTTDQTKSNILLSLPVFSL